MSSSAWRSDRPGPAAARPALSPLFWSHANLYGTIKIDMTTHLDLGLAT